MEAEATRSMDASLARLAPDGQRLVGWALAAGTASSWAPAIGLVVGFAFGAWRLADLVMEAESFRAGAIRVVIGWLVLFGLGALVWCWIARRWRRLMVVASFSSSTLLVPLDGSGEPVAADAGPFLAPRATVLVSGVRGGSAWVLTFDRHRVGAYRLSVPSASMDGSPVAWSALRDGILR